MCVCVCVCVCACCCCLFVRFSVFCLVGFVVVVVCLFLILEGGVLPFSLLLLRVCSFNGVVYFGMAAAWGYLTCTPNRFRKQ